ncbi:hypothetical protein LshimejAT787_0801510 [Lyophyllum shimeji]|uniref:Uncharacterized protein n=1 Tax=Lyophyllum shimeji TaxID=47721 RepID=A0A9P3PQQ5_LYOSH|nr:hypothetical protein LshimejAT787_0801510 [Lyophyllum shimeji]
MSFTRDSARCEIINSKKPISLIQHEWRLIALSLPWHFERRGDEQGIHIRIFPSSCTLMCMTSVQDLHVTIPSFRLPFQNPSGPRAVRWASELVFDPSFPGSSDEANAIGFRVWPTARQPHYARVVMPVSPGRSISSWHISKGS